MSRTVDKKKINDFNIVIERLWNLKGRQDLTNAELKKLNDTIFMTFSIEIWYLAKERSVYCYRREIVKDIKERVPDLFFSNGIKHKIFSFFFKYMPFTYLWLRSAI